MINTENSQPILENSTGPVFSSVDLDDLDIYHVNERLVFPYKYPEDSELDEKIHWRERIEENAPQRVFKWSAYPKTGGRLGKCYLLWGNELKHDYFPFVAIAGPDWKFNLILLLIPVIASACSIGSMYFYDTYHGLRVWVCLLTCLLEECILLVTGFSNPGIVFRGMQPPEEQGKIICKQCKFIRSNIYIHHCFDCDLCYLHLDHHCMWMGKCIGPNTLRLFNISLGGLIVMFIIVSLVPILVFICRCLFINSLH